MTITTFIDRWVRLRATTEAIEVPEDQVFAEMKRAKYTGCSIVHWAEGCPKEISVVDPQRIRLAR